MKTDTLRQNLILIFYCVIKHIIIDKTKNLYKLIIYYFLSTIKMKKLSVFISELSRILYLLFDKICDKI